MEHLTCRASGAEWGFRLDRVRGIVPATPPTRMPGAPPALRGLVAHRGNPLPVLDLAVRLGGAEAVLGRRSCLLLVDASFEGEPLLLGVLVDAVERIVSSEARRFPLPPALQALGEPRICAGFVQTEGALVPLLDPDELLTRGPLWRARPAARPRLAASRPAAAGERPAPSPSGPAAPRGEDVRPGANAAPPLGGAPVAAAPSAAAARGAPIPSPRRAAPAVRPGEGATPAPARAVRPGEGAAPTPARAAGPVETPLPRLAARAGGAPGWWTRPAERTAASPGPVAGSPETIPADGDAPASAAPATRPGPTAAARWIWRSAALAVAAACLALLAATFLRGQAPRGGASSPARAGRGEEPGPSATATSAAARAPAPSAAVPIPAPSPETAAAPPGWVVHEVRQGDSLWALAGRHLGDPWRWPEIYERNRSLVRDPNLIYPRQRIAIPGTVPSAPARDGRPPPP